MSALSIRHRHLQTPEYSRHNHLNHRQAPKSIPISAGNTLNELRILETYETDQPDEIEHIELSSCQIVNVDSSDLLRFTSLRYIDLGDNNVHLTSLQYLPALIELHLHCNGITKVHAISPNGFLRLRVLGLAYNAVTQHAISELSSIPLLNELDLSYNAINSLPVDMVHFSHLLQLSLRNNKLVQHEVVFKTLATIPLLQRLDISHNSLKRVPSSFVRNMIGFEELVFLDISFNDVVSETDLLALAGFVSLQTSDVRGNPFILSASERRTHNHYESEKETMTSLSKAYPLLYNSLVLPCNITLIIQDTQPKSLMAFTSSSCVKSASDSIPKPQLPATNVKCKVLGINNDNINAIAADSLSFKTVFGTRSIGIQPAIRMVKFALARPLCFHKHISNHSSHNLGSKGRRVESDKSTRIQVSQKMSAMVNPQILRYSCNMNILRLPPLLVDIDNKLKHKMALKSSIQHELPMAESAPFTTHHTTTTTTTKPMIISLPKRDTHFIDDKSIDKTYRRIINTSRTHSTTPQTTAIISRRKKDKNRQQKIREKNDEFDKDENDAVLHIVNAVIAKHSR